MVVVFGVLAVPEVILVVIGGFLLDFGWSLEEFLKDGVKLTAENFIDSEREPIDCWTKRGGLTCFLHRARRLRRASL